MKLLADEGVDSAIVTRLRSDGHDVVYVAELSPGITDEAVLELANTTSRRLGCVRVKRIHRPIWMLPHGMFWLWVITLCVLLLRRRAGATAKVLA